MGMLCWVMMGLAIWHFTVFVPDRFWGGIVGAFVGATLGAVLTGLLFHGFSIPSQDDTSILTVLEAVPGCLLGMAAIWAIGVSRERAEGGAGADALGRPAA